MKDMRCMYCDRKIPEDSAFCPYCGKDMGSGREVDELQERLLKQLSKEITGELPDMSWKEQERHEYVRERPVKSSKRYLGVIGLVILVMILLIAAIWILFTTMDANERRMQEEREQSLKESREKELEADKEEPSEDEDRSKAGNAEISLSFISEPGDFGQYYKLPVEEASASSVISQEGVDNSAFKAVDGNSKTSWQEGVDGDGIGESIHLKLPKPYMVKYMSFQLGNWNSKEYYDNNNRPKELEITAGDITQSVTFPDGQVEYWVEFSEECPASEIEMVIRSVYEGSQWDDTCIAEIGIYGKGN